MNCKNALGHCFFLPDLFENFDMRRLTMSCKDYSKFACDRHREDIVYKIFKDSVQMVINDVIENNVTFQLPTGKRPAEIHMQKFTDDQFMEMKKNGAFKGVDFLKSYFTGYQVYFYMNGGGHQRKKPIYVRHDYRDRISQKTNEGMQYC